MSVRSNISARDSMSQVGIYYAMEFMARRVSMASQLIVTDAAGTAVANGTPGAQLRMGWDYDAAGTPTNGGLGDTDPANDTWTTFGFVEEGAIDRLRFTGPVVAAVTVNNTHTQIYPGLSISNAVGNSSFTLSNSAATPNTVTIRLVANVGSPARTLVVQRNVTPYATPN
jgi:hypothetical protein